MTRRDFGSVVLGALVIVGMLSCGDGTPGFRFEVVVPGDLASAPVDGRVLLLVSTTDDPEPRLQRLRSLDSPLIFGVDVDGLAPGEPAVIDSSARGFPIETIAEIPPGEYFVQAVLNVYTTFNRADGHTIKAHMDQWEGQHWNRSPGNLYSPVERMTIDPASGNAVSVTLSEKIPSLDPPDTTDILPYYRFPTLPWEDATPWIAHSSLFHVGSITTPTMLITGEDDLRTPISQAEQFSRALKFRKIPTALLRYKNQAHGTGTRPSNFMRTQLYLRYWFEKYGGKDTEITAGEP